MFKLQNYIAVHSVYVTFLSSVSFTHAHIYIYLQKYSIWKPIESVFQNKQKQNLKRHQQRYLILVLISFTTQQPASSYCLDDALWQRYCHITNTLTELAMRSGISITQSFTQQEKPCPFSSLMQLVSYVYQSLLNEFNVKQLKLSNTDFPQ